MTCKQISGIPVIALTIALLHGSLIAQDSDTEQVVKTYPWCNADVRRAFESGTIRVERIMANMEESFELSQWPVPNFPGEFPADTLLRFDVTGGSYVWWFDTEWHRVSARAAVIERTGLIYGIGSVEQVVRGSALIDMGDIHTLKRRETVALFRRQNTYHVPVGVLVIEDTEPTTCRTYSSTAVKAQAGDIAIFVREFREMQTGTMHRDDFISNRIIKTSGSASYSTHRRQDIAQALLRYQKDYPNWERSRRDVLGYVYGESFATSKTASISRLLKHIEMLREKYQAGRTSLPAAGETWEAVMPHLVGQAILEQHQAAIAAQQSEGNIAADSRPSIQDIDRSIRQSFFDQDPEAVKLLSFLVTTFLEESPRDQDLWMQTHFRRSVMPQLADETDILEKLRDLVRALQNAK